MLCHCTGAPCPVRACTSPSACSACSSPTRHLPLLTNWYTATGSPAFQARSAVPNAAVDLPFMSPVLTTSSGRCRRCFVVSPSSGMSVGWASGISGPSCGEGDDGQAGGRPVVDERAKRGRVEVLLDEVAEGVEVALTDVGVRRVRRGREVAARDGGDLTQEGTPKAVALQRAVPGRPPHRADPAAPDEGLRAVVGDRDAVVDLVGRCHRLPVRLTGRAGQHLLGTE